MESSKESVVHYARGLFLASFAAFIFTSMMTTAAVGGPLIDEHLTASVANTKLAMIKAPLHKSADGCVTNFAGVEIDNPLCRGGDDLGGGSGGGSGWTIPAGASATLTVTPATVDPGQTVSVSWETSGIKSCIITEDGKEISKYTDYTNLKRGPLSAETVYALSCLGDDKNTKIDKTVTVKVETATGAPTVTITADPSTVDYNGTSKISWQSVGADSCAILKNGVEVGRGNSYDAKNLLSDTVFKVRCLNKQGSVADTVEVAVRPPQAPKVQLQAEPAAVAYNGSTKITWSSEYANSCTVKRGTITIGTGLVGEKEVTGLKTDTRFVLSCVGMVGTKTEQDITVTVAKPEVPTVLISAETPVVAYEGKTKITWSSTNADTCTVTGAGMRRSAPAGTYDTPVLTKNMAYSISCTGPGGKVQAETVVTVQPPVRPTVTLSVSGTEVELGKTVQLQWSSTGARECGVYQNNTLLKARSTSMTSLTSQKIMGSTVFWVSCVGAGGSVAASHVVQVVPAAANAASSSLGGGSIDLTPTLGSGSHGDDVRMNDARVD